MLACICAEGAGISVASTYMAAYNFVLDRLMIVAPWQVVTVYQSDRDIESGRSKLSTGWGGRYVATLGATLGRWQAGWAQLWPKAYLTTGQVKPVSEPDSEDHTRRYQAAPGTCRGVPASLDALQLPQLLDPDLGVKLPSRHASQSAHLAPFASFCNPETRRPG